MRDAEKSQQKHHKNKAGLNIDIVRSAPKLV